MFNDILKLLDKEEAVKFLQKILQYDTTNPPGNEKALAQYIADTLENFGIKSHLDMLADQRANVVGCLPGSGERKTLLFNGHLDVVPAGEQEWRHPPFGGQIDEGKIYGRGASDMKGGLAAMVMAAGLVARAGVSLKGDLLITATAGEETDSIGARDLVERGYLQNVDAALIGEPSNLKLFSASKGALWLEFKTVGKTAHGSMPDQGCNAILQMNDLVNELNQYVFTGPEHPMLGQSTINIATIHGGVKTNVVPDGCTLTVDIRTVPGESHDKIIADIEAIIARLAGKNQDFRASLTIMNNRPPVETDVTCAAMEHARQAAVQVLGKELLPGGVNFYTDGSVFAPLLGIPVVLFGPGDEKLAHQPDEYVEIDKYIDAIKFYVAFILNHLA
ncbi:MAG: M20 family metallopeptidase [Syntrophomonadaceae bacterium]|jgi:succinyl-diaminopimelate desuccinylase